jgi:hypothetical protein
MSQASTKVIFKREFDRKNADVNESFFVQLSADVDSPLASVQPIAMTITEAFSFATPIVSVTFNDGNGIYFNSIKMDTEQEYFLDMGGSKFTATRLPIRIAKVELKNIVAGKSTQVTFKVTFVHKGWNELLNIRHNRGFSKQTYSDIVKSIMSECNYTSIKTTPSKGQHSVIQPYWTNNVFLKWVQSRATPLKSDDHFEFSCNINGDFFFSSMTDIVTSKKQDIIDKKIPILNLGSYDPNSQERKRDLKENFNIPNHFSDFMFNEHYMDTVINGGGGTVALNYDYNSGSFINKELKMSSSTAVQLSDVTSMKVNHEKTKYRVYAGSDDAVAIATSTLSSVALSMNEFRITTDGTINAHVGQVVELIIRTERDMYKSPYSMIHNGFFVIASVTHQVSMAEGNDFITIITLARSGINGKDLKGYVKTKSGKFI